MPLDDPASSLPASPLHRRRALQGAAALLLAACGAGAGARPPTADDTDALHWTQAEADVRGDFLRLLALVQRAPLRPAWRVQRSAREHAELLQRAGRFDALGVTPEQGRALVAAYWRRQGRDPDAPALPALRAAGRAPGGEPAAAAPLAKPAPPTVALPPAGWRASREFDPQSAVLLRWPFDQPQMREGYAQLVRAVVGAGVDAWIWVDNNGQRTAAQRFLLSRAVPLTRVRWKLERTDSVWLRDYGPAFVYGPTPADWLPVDFRYYSSRPDDDDTPQVVALANARAVVDRQGADALYTEGGNLSTDGLGSVLYSRRTYARNPGLASTLVDQRIGSALNAPNRLVLQDPALDATGHVDMFSKIVAPDTVLVGQYDPGEFDHAALEASAALLAGARNGAGQPWKVVRIRQPDVYYEGVVNPVVRTYTNALMLNDRVIVPTYGIAEDAAALAQWQALLPNRAVLPIDARALITQGGAWHCVALQFAGAGVP